MIPFTTKRTFLVVFFLGLFTMAAGNANDPDLWWHLKTGEYIAAHQSVPRTDPFSYTRLGQPWVAHEWLTELGLYELYRVTGFTGLILAFAAVLVTAFVLLYLRCGPAPYIAGAITLWGALATMPVWGVRPQVISLFLTSLWLLILERAEKDHRLLWWTAPLTLLWVNVHAGFALGLTVFAIFLIGALVERALGSRKPSSPWREGTILFAIDLLLISVNPNGLRMYSYPIETLRSVAMQNYIAEWASPNFHHAGYWPFFLLVLATFVTLACTRTPIRVRDLLLLLASLFASLESIRMIPFFVLIAVPIVARRLGTWPRTDRRSPLTRLQLALNTTIILATVTFAAVHIHQVIDRQPSVEAREFPTRAVAFLGAHPPDGRIFNHYDWGGYLIWKLYPPVQVFIDGRADLYGEQLFHDFAAAYQFKDDWGQILQRWHVQTVLIPSDSALATGLLANREWKVTYRDSQATIFTLASENRSSVASAGLTSLASRQK
jgi:hypothetical protein